MYRFIGMEAEIGGVARLTKFGQAVELTDELARDAILGDCALLSEDEFKELGFTAEELNRYAYPGARQSAPAEFQSKVKAALIRLHEIREDLQGGK